MPARLYPKQYLLEAACILAALGSSLASLWAVSLVAFLANTQTAVDPVTHGETYLPWWTIFRGGDAVPTCGLLAAGVGLGWLGWHFCRRAYHLGRWT